jgi:hypothetical protein
MNEINKYQLETLNFVSQQVAEELKEGETVELSEEEQKDTQRVNEAEAFEEENRN